MKSVDSLADRLLALEASFPCFSCGSGSLTWSPSSSGHPGILTCPQCGAEMTTGEASAAESGFETDDPALCMAA